MHSLTSAIGSQNIRVASMFIIPTCSSSNKFNFFKFLYLFTYNLAYGREIDNKTRCPLLGLSTHTKIPVNIIKMMNPN